MDHLLSARALMGISLGFHIIYVVFGIGLPLLLFIAEGLSLRKGNEHYHQIARSWVRPMVVLFAIGAVSGTILSFELGLLWPVFMGFSGPMIGLPFWLEGFAFFTEAIFLGLYVYGEKRLSRRTLFLTTIPIVIASSMSAVFVISANSWMNTPSGFDLVNGQLALVRPFDALSNPAWPHEAIHGTLSTYVAASFAIAGIYAFFLLRGRKSALNYQALALTLAVGVVSVPFMLITGDYSAVQVAKNQPAKLAAMELLPVTTKGAPLVLGGYLNPATNQVHLGIKIPYGLSLLAFRNPNAVVTGLDAFPANLRPDPNLVHPFFDLMVISFFIMFGAALWFWFVRWRAGKHIDNRLLWLAILVASPFGLIAVEAGWFVTEFGRQPWIARGVMLVSQGVTPQTGIIWVLVTFILVYLALTSGLLWLLLRPIAIKPGIEPPKEAGNGTA